MIEHGNIAEDTADTRGWIVGAFRDGGLLKTNAVEVKWGAHDESYQRDSWAEGETRTTIALLIEGNFTVVFRDREVELSEPGDYVIWGPGESHKSRANHDSKIVTIRWPSEKTTDI